MIATTSAERRSPHPTTTELHRIVPGPDGPFAFVIARSPNGDRVVRSGWLALGDPRALLGSSSEDRRLMPELAERLRATLEGSPDGLADDFTDLELPEALPFTIAARTACRHVRAGTTTTYAELAAAALALLGEHRDPNHCARAAGQAMRRNPTPILVPCHRVVAAGGRSLGGFSGWTDPTCPAVRLKERLLERERVGMQG
jgi:methylated-DNA-[protein]-cysteine S-methyltransferase